MSSRYSGGGSDYRSSNGGDYRGGYHGNRYSGGGFASYGKINEDDVPESQHSIFVRGLPSSITYDEIKNFFEDNIGPCSFDFQKVNYERQSLFVAVRFESKDHAKEAYNKYREGDILGCRCEVTWFRDIRRYISYQQQNGGTIRRGNFGRGQANRYHTNSRPEYRKRRYSDDRRSRSRSYSDSDRSRSRSRRSSRSRSSRSRSRSEGERSTSRDSERRPRSESKDEKRKKKEKKAKKSKKERRSRRSESRSSEGERSRSSSRGSERDRSDSRKRSKNGRKDRDISPASSTGSPLRMTPPPVAPSIPIIGPVIPSASTTPALPPASVSAAAPVEKSGPLSGVVDVSDDGSSSSRSRSRGKRGKKRSKKEKREREREREQPSSGGGGGRSGGGQWEGFEKLPSAAAAAAAKKEDNTKITITIANKATVPVEMTSFKMQLDTDEPPRKIVRGPLTPEKKDESDAMDVEEKEEEEERVPLRKEPAPAEGKGGWRTVGDNSGPPSDVAPPLAAAALFPAGTPEKPQHVNGFDMVPRSVGGTPGGTPNPPPPKRLPPPGTPSHLPPPGRPSIGGGGALALRCPEMSKVVREIKSTQDALVATVRANPLRLSDLSSGESVLEKMEERERLYNDLDPAQKAKFALKIKQITTSYKGDSGMITTVVKSLVQKDPSLEEQIKPALLSVLEDIEKQIYKKVDDFLTCGL